MSAALLWFDWFDLAIKLRSSQQEAVPKVHRRRRFLGAHGGMDEQMLNMGERKDKTDKMTHEDWKFNEIYSKTCDHIKTEAMLSISSGFTSPPSNVGP